MSTPDVLRSSPAAMMKELESYITSHPGNAAAHFRLGQVYQAGHDRHNALKHFAEAVRLSPLDLNFRKMLADFQYVELGDLESAITNYVRILEQEPRNIENLTILGNIAVSMSRFAEARTFFSTVARLEPWNTEVQMILEAIARKQDGGSPAPTYQAARALAESGRTSEAIRALEQIVAADPHHVLAHNDLGVLYGSQGNVDLALNHARAAVEAESDNITARKNLADLYHTALRDPETAMHHYLEILRRAPADIETLLAIGSLCVSINKPEEARSFFSAVLGHQPDHLLAQELVRRLGAAPNDAAVVEDVQWMFDDPKIERIMREKEQYAREYLTDVLQQEPSNRSARRGLEGLSMNAGDHENDTGSRYAEATRLVAQGQADAGRQLLEEILVAHPSFAPAHNDLAVLAGDAGDTEKAREHYERALALEPDNLIFRKNLADLYFVRLGRVEDALRLYVSILEKSPRDAETLLSLGILCAERGQIEDARTFLRAVLTIEPGNEPARTALRTIEAA